VKKKDLAERKMSRKRKATTVSLNPGMDFTKKPMGLTDQDEEKSNGVGTITAKKKEIGDQKPILSVSKLLGSTNFS